MFQKPVYQGPIPILFFFFRGKKTQPALFTRCLTLPLTSHLSPAVSGSVPSSTASWLSDYCLPLLLGETVTLRGVIKIVSPVPVFKYLSPSSSVPSLRQRCLVLNLTRRNSVVVWTLRFYTSTCPSTVLSSLLYLLDSLHSVTNCVYEFFEAFETLIGSIFFSENKAKDWEKIATA